MHLVLLELTQQVVYLLGFGHEIRWPYETLPAECSRFRQMREQILDVKDASDIIGIVLIDRYSAVIIIDYALQNLCETASNVKIYNVLTRGHDLFGRLITKADNALKHALLVFDIFLVGKFKRLFKVINTQLAVLFLHYFLRKDTAFD